MAETMENIFSRRVKDLMKENRIKNKSRLPTAELISIIVSQHIGVQQDGIFSDNMARRVCF